MTIGRDVTLMLASAVAMGFVTAKFGTSVIVDFAIDAVLLFAIVNLAMDVLSYIFRSVWRRLKARHNKGD